MAKEVAGYLKLQVKGGQAVKFLSDSGDESLKADVSPPLLVF